MKKLLIVLSAIVLSLNFSAFSQLRVSSGTGNVGIGQNSPSEKLVVAGNLMLENNGKLLIRTTDRYFGLATPSDMGLVNNAQSWLRMGSAMGIAFWGDVGADDQSPTAPQHNMFLNRYGLGIGPGAQAWGGTALYVQGDALASGTFYSNSDSRFKKNIRNITSPLATILKLHGKSFEYNRENFPEKNFDSRVAFGFIAQELKDVLPELVKEDNKGFLSVNYTGIIPYLIEALKEEHAHVESQEIVIKELSHKINDFQSQLTYCCKTEKGKLADTDNFITGSESKLFQNIPNPFKEGTTIEYYIAPGAGESQIFIFDMQGNLLLTYSDLNPGSGTLRIAGNNLNAGMFMYSLVVDGTEVNSKRMILTK